jgi:hypothetical protein
LLFVGVEDEKQEINQEVENSGQEVKPNGDGMPSNYF